MKFQTTAQACLLAASLLLAACGNEDMRTKAVQSLQKKNFSAAAEQAGAVTQKAPDDYEMQFLLAQAQAQLGNRNAALAALEAAIKNGYKDDQAIRSNANLQSLAGMSAYEELMAASFPRAVAAAPAAAPATAVAAGDVGITETRDKTVIKAGDVSIEMPKE